MSLFTFSVDISIETPDARPEADYVRAACNRLCDEMPRMGDEYIKEWSAGVGVDIRVHALRLKTVATPTTLSWEDDDPDEL